MTLKLTGRALKCSVVLDPAALLDVVVPNGVPHVPVIVQVANRVVTASLNAKTLRRTVATVRESGVENVALVLQGKLVGDVLEEAGLAAQMKAPRPAV